MKFYQRNDHVINHKINVNFEDLLEMDPDSFNEWVEELRDVIKYSWDNNNCPPRTGKDEYKIIENWNLLESVLLTILASIRAPGRQTSSTS